MPYHESLLPQYDKIRSKVVHQLLEQPSPYNAKNTAKWSRMLIKMALLFGLNDAADEMEKQFFYMAN